MERDLGSKITHLDPGTILHVFKKQRQCAIRRYHTYCQNRTLYRTYNIPCVSSLTVPIQVYYESTSYITTLVTETPSSDYNAQSLRIMQLSSIPNSRFTMWSQRQMLLHIIHIYELTHLEVHSIA
ncbi:hypothetical protein IWW34DRAFT_820862 [Fusarium oxysporum f. sp. albedinis]|nr:hypothetical protein IWW34DRAFT_820862 [Fusarium oxysporum f. sp. albedinis]